MAGVKGRSGPRPKTIDTRETHKVLTAAGKVAASKLFEYIKEKTEKGRKVKPISGTKLKAWELAINHAIGTPRQKVDIRHSGDILTLRDLAEMARQHDLKDFETLEETKELAGKVGDNAGN